MSLGQSLRNGNSVEPGLPNTFLMPKARSRLKVASLTVMDLLAALAGLRDDMSVIPGMSQSSLRGRNDGAVHLSMDWFAKSSSVPARAGTPSQFHASAGNHPVVDPACQIRTSVYAALRPSAVREPSR